MLFDYLKSLFKHTVFYGFGSLFISLTGFILIPLYTKVLTVEEYGIFSIITIFAGIMAYIYDLGIPQALTRYYYDFDTQEDKTRMISTALWFFVLTSTLFTIILILNSKFLSMFLLRKDVYFVLVQLAVLSVFLNNLSYIPITLLRIDEKSVLFMNYTVIKGVVLMLLTFVMLVIFKKGLLGIYQALVITAFISCLFVFIISPKRYSLSFSKKYLTSMLKYGIPFLPVMITTWAIDFSNRFFIEHFAGISYVGIYSLGCRLAQVVYMAIVAFLLCWGPFLFSTVKKQSEKAPEIISKLITYILLGFMALVLLVSVFNKEFVLLMTRNPDFYSAYKVLPVVALAYFFFGMCFLFLSGLLVAKKVYQQPIILTLGTALNIALNFVLIPRYKMMGAAVSMLFSYLLIAVATYIVSQRKYFIPYEIKRILCLIFTAIFIFMLSRFIMQENLVLSILIKTILLLLFPFILFFFKFFNRGELNRLKLIFIEDNKIWNVERKI